MNDVTNLVLLILFYFIAILILTAGSYFYGTNLIFSFFFLDPRQFFTENSSLS